jgi:aspartate/methionine/tyrosine aminotransferase
MSAGDMQLVRSHDPGSFNLAVGEPFFLQEQLSFAQAIAPEGPFLYPHTRGEPELLKELERRHHGMHVVVTNGAKQAISAALAAYAEVYGRTWAHHATPYWPSYPILTAKELAWGMTSGASREMVSIITSPNNPDGQESDKDCDIWDAAYASPVYGFTTPPAHWTVAIYSAAKMLGLSGLRVGWAVTADARLAEAMTTYVERYSSGVCVTSQRHIAHVLRHLRMHDDHVFFDVARKTLLANGETFKKLMGDHVALYDGVPATGRGMFAWFQVREAEKESFDKALEATKVRLVTGQACGEVGNLWYRLSMGHHQHFTEQALEALTRAWRV